jgi:hypothetical protein
VHGYDTSRDEDARLLQHAVPPGEPIGFWGASAARLDHARNPIRDVSWARRRLAPLAAERLGGVGYVLIEEVFTRPPPRRVPDPRGESPPPPTGSVESLELVASRGAIRLYRIGR